jgi:hypothetical protein
MNSMPLAVFLFSLLSSFGVFTDFLLGTVGKGRIKDALANWYVRLGTRSWADLAVASANAVDEFLTAILGRRLVSPHALSRILAFCSVFDTALIFSVYAPKIWGRPHSSLRYFWWGIPLVVLSNALVSLVSLALIRLSYRSVKIHKPVWALAGSVFIDVLLTYLAVATADTLMTTTFIALDVSYVDTARPRWCGCWLTILPSKALRSFSLPWLAPLSLGGINASLFTISAFLPSLLHLAAFSVLCLFALSKRWLQSPVMYLMERLDDSRDGIFTRLGTACGALAALLALFKH